MDARAERAHEAGGRPADTAEAEDRADRAVQREQRLPTVNRPGEAACRCGSRLASASAIASTCSAIGVA